MRAAVDCASSCIYCSFGSSWGGFFGSLGLCKLGPNVLPVVGAQFLQNKCMVNFVQLAGKTGAGKLQTFADLIKVLLVDFDLLSDFTPPLWAVVWYRHVTNSSVLLAFVKLRARKCL